ncbi:PREDICTED: uncharacterized protein LOC109592548, partial [Amphimedon queenslandica]|uniref:Uncharacterized protein n=1 Tax=Amphimedon queenslandica TaxID=400682 RepID=A0AAN0K2H1_AMPQE
EVFCSDDLVVMNDDDGLKIYLPQSMTAQFTTMRLKFGQTFLKVEKCIKEKSPAHEDIKNILSYSLEDLECQIAQCQSINSILKLIRDKSSLNDISMLEFFVTELNIQKAKGVIQEYNEAITEFSETKLSQCLHERFSYTSALPCERITIVVDEDVADRTIKDIKKLSKSIFKKLSPHVKLNVVRDGNSFTITCSFPLILSEQLITAALNNIDVLKENKVKRLTIGYCTVYEVLEIDDTSPSATIELYEHQRTSSLSTSSGLMKQLMLSLSVQLINSKEEVTTFNE